MRKTGPSNIRTTALVEPFWSVPTDRLVAIPGLFQALKS